MQSLILKKEIQLPPIKDLRNYNSMCGADKNVKDLVVAN